MCEKGMPLPRSLYSTLPIECVSLPLLTLTTRNHRTRIADVLYPVLGQEMGSKGLWWHDSCRRGGSELQGALEILFISTQHKIQLKPACLKWIHQRLARDGGGRMRNSFGHIKMLVCRENPLRSLLFRAEPPFPLIPAVLHLAVIPTRTPVL